MNSADACDRETQYAGRRAAPRRAISALPKPAQMGEDKGMKKFFLSLLAMSMIGLPAWSARLPLRSAGNSFSLKAADSVVSSADARFLNIHGQIEKISQTNLSQEIENTFIRPLQEASDKFLFTYVIQSEPEGRFNLNLALESVDQSSAELLHQYILEREHNGFHGLQVQFQKIVAILEFATLQMGFAQQTEHRFAFLTLQAWHRFQDRQEIAFRDLKGTELTSLLSEFEVDRNQLGHGSRLTLKPRVNLLLEDGTSVAATSESSPFFDNSVLSISQQQVTQSSSNGLKHHD